MFSEAATHMLNLKYEMYKKLAPSVRRTWDTCDMLIYHVQSAETFQCHGRRQIGRFYEV
jgi:3-methyladenine DNA glycosylase AlkD